jgi:hypothetical protein
MIKKYIGLHVKCPLLLSDFNYTSVFTTDFRKIYNCQISLGKIPPVEAEFFQEDGPADGQTDRHDEANSRFSQLCERA